MGQLATVLHCAGCGHDLARGVQVVRRGAVVVTTYARASWGTLEAQGTDTLSTGASTVECPECGQVVTPRQCAALGLDGAGQA